MRVLTLKSGKTQRNLERLRKWCGFTHDFAGAFTSPTNTGYKTLNRKGDMVFHIWERK